MIERETVFILGAGASNPYGFPIGQELTDTILTGLQAGQDMYRTLSQIYPSDQIENFRTAFLRSARYSIDSFLQHRSEHGEVGRAAIAFVIMGLEHPGHLWSRTNHDWYRLLVNKMSAKVEEFEKNKISFVTFNYDRSLEFYLIQHVAGAYGLSDGDAASKVSKFPLLHLHGDVGALPWFNAGGRSYKTNTSPESIELYSKRIHIVHDELGERAGIFEHAKKLILNAQRIIILGFGFEQTNIDRLSLKALGNEEVIATTLGMKTAEVHDVRVKMGWKIQPLNVDCLELLRDKIIL